MIARDLSIEDISVGDTVSFDRTWSEDDVAIFAKLSGDTSPLHMDEEYAKKTRFGSRLVHGLLVGAACSELVGMRLPGKRNLHLRQSLTFRNPVFIGDTVTVKGTVRTKSFSTGILEIDILITKDGTPVIEGVEVVQVLT